VARGVHFGGGIKMQLGFVSAIFAELPLEKVLAFASAEGYQCVEVMCWPGSGPDRKFGGVCHLEVDGFTQAQADDVRALCEKYGVAISALGYYSNPLAADSDEAERGQVHLKKVIDAAQLLGLSIVNSFVGAHTKLPLDDNLQRFADVWPDLIRHAEDRGIKVGIENCPMLFKNTWPFGMNLARTPAIWRRMFEIIPSMSFGLNYDPSHLVMQLIDPIEPIREFGPRIFHAHAKDMRIDRDRLQDVGSLETPMTRSTAKLPGLGDVHWGRWIGALADVHYNGAVCVEVEDEAFTETLAGRERSLRISRNVLQPIVI
jgi:sugar phosphate isomerase/epimerase